jgi:hypothetical protein
MTRACTPYFLTQIRGPIYFNCTERPSPLGCQNRPHKLHYQAVINYSTLFTKHWRIDLSTSSRPDRWVLIPNFRHEVCPIRKRRRANIAPVDTNAETTWQPPKEGIPARVNQLGFYCARYFKGEDMHPTYIYQTTPIGAKAQNWAHAYQWLCDL